MLEIMRYKVGMYGGSFDPLHNGHVAVLLEAASKCEELYVVLSYSRARDYVPMELRYRWIRNLVKHIGNVKIICLEDKVATKADYNEAEWERGRDEILASIGKSLDVVFCGSDYKGSERYEKLYQCKVEYISREMIPISSSMLRRNELKYWDYLPREVQSYFAKKVLIIGTESTGKSTLAKNLASIYNTSVLEEVGRDVCENAGGEEFMIAEDFQEILLRHKVKELDAIKSCNRILFVDTDALTTRYYSQFLLSSEEEKQKNYALADAIADINHFDLILFLEPGTPFIQDGTRNEEIGANPNIYADKIKQLFDARGMQYHCIGGDYANRLEEARKLVDQLLGEV